MRTPDNRAHNLSDMHNWALLGKIIINLCVSHGGRYQSRETQSRTPTLPPAPSGSSAPSFTALKRCNNRRVRQLCWGVFTPAVRGTSKRCSFQLRLNSPIPGGRSPSPAVALRDVLYVRACVCVCFPGSYCGQSVLRSICQPDSLTYT